MRIFFGASAGVGKTHAMLEAARSARAAGTDVVVGYVEPHGPRRDGKAPQRAWNGCRHSRCTIVASFVTSSISIRRCIGGLKSCWSMSWLTPICSVVSPEPRHPKRWQDVEELLDAGINVWTTVNVQHLESLNDLVAQITGVRQRETLPDRVFDEADEIELIDLPPDELLARLRAGKIYVPDEISSAAERFFRKPNLMALRELRAAARGRPRRGGRTSLARCRPRPSQGDWPGDRVMVAIGPDRTG